MSFRLLFTARVLSLLGDAAVPAALALAVLRATGSTGALALVLAAAMTPRLLLMPLGGVLADRFSARAVALATDVAACAAQAFAAVELLGGEPRLWHLAAAQFAGGAASAFGTPAISPLVAAAVPAGRLQRANALLSTAGGAARLAGPALGGALVLTAGPGWTFLLDSATFAASALLLLGVRVRHVRPPRRTLRADLAEGWTEVRSRDWYWTSLVTHSLWNFASAVLMTLGPLIAVRRLGGEGAWVATLQAGAAGLVVGSLAAARLRPRRPVLVANAGLTVFALPLLAFAVPLPAPVAIGSYGLAMIGLGVLNPIWETLVQRSVPPGVLARVTSYDFLASLGAMPLGYALAPLAAAAWGAGVPLAVAAALVAGSCLGVLALPGVRTFAGPLEAAAEVDAVPA
ncbi:MFS transporter [Actinomadura parmotrematis]|uniref:MFS transporter n=1 Tax=Actinomadura parmotrematis TaxID=2864039 RepID=A0ABS7FRF1_9ACTN|nr:MFS transporter [Actinomadura parmotrematis]MBW8482891.1 MFS transporter [Actinomadura parmotrematis]